MNIFKNKKSMAFTLAEILMVMGILGVVAAITVPNLNKSVGDQERVAKVQTMVADVEQAYKVALRKYEDGWSNSAYGPRILEFMQIKKSCNVAIDTTCFKNSGIKVYNDSKKVSFMRGTAAVFNDGSAIYFFPETLNGNIYEFNPLTDAKQLVYIDIDGPTSGYNTLGVDIFSFVLDENGLMNVPINTFSSGDSAYRNIDYTYWILKYGNAEFLHCTGLSESKTTCN